MIDSRPGGAVLDAYVADLERRLASADPGERADIVASVREHVEADLAGLGRPATSADVEASLTTLGSVDTVVAAWAPDGAAAPAVVPAWLPPPAPAVPPAPLSSRARVLLAVAAVAGIALAVVFPPALLLLPLVLLMVGIIGARRHPGHRTPWVVTAVLGGVLIPLTLVIGPLLFVITTSSPSTVDEGPAVEVESVAPTP